jgi:A/G-specific adenine glycosylase
MMEFGAILCKPKNPACGICPVRSGCFAFINNATTSLPVKLNKVKIRERFFNYFLITDGDKILINKRNESDIWANMYDLPLIETKDFLETDKLNTHPEFIELFGKTNLIKESLSPKKHILTHQHLNVRFVKLANAPVKMKPDWVFIDIINLKKLALPNVIFIFLDNFLN